MFMTWGCMISSTILTTTKFRPQKRTTASNSISLRKDRVGREGAKDVSRIMQVSSNERREAMPCLTISNAQDSVYSILDAFLTRLGVFRYL